MRPVVVKIREVIAKKKEVAKAASSPIKVIEGFPLELKVNEAEVSGSSAGPA
jgi:hypothetical protein